MAESRCWPMEVDGVSTAKRRRQRRLRSWWRHEQQTVVAAVVATFQHHSAPQGLKKARNGEGGSREELRGDDPDASYSPAGALQLV